MLPSQRHTPFVLPYQLGLQRIVHLEDRVGFDAGNSDSNDKGTVEDVCIEQLAEGLWLERPLSVQF